MFLQSFADHRTKMSDQDIAVACISFVILHTLLKKNKKVRRRWWSSQLYLNRRRLNNVNNTFLLTDMLTDKDSGKFVNFVIMSQEDFNFLLNSVKDKIRKRDTTFRLAVPPEERLAVTLRFLATGDSFTSLQYLFKISKQLISEIVPEVCQTIIDFLIGYIKVSKTIST